MSAAAALHHGGPLDRATSHVRALVRELATGLDLREVLDRILAAALDATNADGYLLVARCGPEDLLASQGLDEGRLTDLATRLKQTGEIDETLLEVGTHTLVAPIDAGVAEVGWLATFHSGPHPAGEDRLSRLEHLGHVIGAALVVADAFDRTERTSALNAALLDLSEQLAQERDEVVIARRVAELMPTIVGADRTAVLLMDPDDEVLKAVAAVGFGDLTEAAMDVTIPATTPALKRLIAAGKPRWIDRSSDDPLVLESMNAFDDEFASVAPIVADDEVLGLVVALHPDDSATRSEEPMQVLSSVADQAAIAISRRRLLDEALHAATHDHHDRTG